MKEHNAMFRVLAETCSAGIFIYQDGRFRYANPATESLTGYSLKELSTMNYRDITHPEFGEILIGTELTVSQGETVHARYESKLLTKNKEEKWVDISATAINLDGRPAVLVAAFDITERKLTEAALKRSEARYRAIVDDQTELICRFLPDGTLCFVSQTFCRYFGKNSDDLIGTKFFSLISEDDHAKVVRQLVSLVESSPVTAIEFRVVAPDGEPRWHQWTVRAFFDSQSHLTEYQAVGRDITYQKNKEKELLSMALVDELTGLYNRRGLLTLSEQEIKVANRLNKKMLLLYADIDDLKLINDSFGHQEGDFALIDTATLLRETFRESDIIARVGGDEFIVLVIEKNNTIKEILYARLQESIASYNRKSHRRAKLSISMGIASYDPAHPRFIDELIFEADKLMYEHKRNKQKDNNSSH